MIAPQLECHELDDFSSMLDYLDALAPDGGIAEKAISGLRSLSNIGRSFDENVPSMSEVSTRAGNVARAIAENAPGALAAAPLGIAAAGKAIGSGVDSAANAVTEPLRNVARWAPYVAAGIGLLVLWRILR